MKFSLKDYLPLIYVYILSVFITLIIYALFRFSPLEVLSVFLGIFSLIFSVLKIFRLENFVEAFSEYDFVTQKFKFYAYSFPFLELFFGVSFLLLIDNLWVEVLCLAFFSLNLISVFNALSKKRKFYCACLGDLIKVPLSYVTLVENITMIVGVLILIYF